MKARFEQVEDYLYQAEALNSPDFSALRKKSAEALETYGFPALKTEAWKYTNAKPLLRHSYQSAKPDAISAEQVKQFLLQNAFHLVFVNGFYQEQYSTINANDIVISPILDAKEEVGKIAPMEQTGFVALNTLLFQQGYFITIKAKLQKPLHILHIASHLEADEVIYNRNVIVAEQKSKVDLVEQYVALNNDAQYWRNSVSEVFIQANASLNYYRVQQESFQAYHTHFMTVQQHDDSRFSSFSIDLGGKLVRNDLQTKLIAKGAQCELNGLYLARDKQHIDNHTEICHEHSDTFSKEYYKGILTDAAKAVFNGRVVVLQQAQKTESEQRNANILLSAKCEIFTKPELEIYADDVRCTHGATVGQLSEKSVSYLQSRGISEEMARKLLTYGFAYEVLETIAEKSVHDFIRKQLGIWFHDDSVLQEMVQ